MPLLIIIILSIPCIIATMSALIANGRNRNWKLDDEEQTKYLAQIASKRKG